LRNAPESSNISDNLAAHVGAKTSVTGFKSMTGVAVGVTGVAVMLVLRHLLGAGAKHLEETRKALAAVKTQDAETCTRISSAASAWARRVSPAKCVQNFSTNTRRTTRLQLKYAVYELPAAPAARQRVQGVFELPQIRVKYFLRYFPPCSCPRAHTGVVGVVAAFSRFSPTPTPSRRPCPMQAVDNYPCWKMALQVAVARSTGAQAVPPFSPRATPPPRTNL
jgi:hypothetical protein